MFLFEMKATGPLAQTQTVEAVPALTPMPFALPDTTWYFLADALGGDALALPALCTALYSSYALATALCGIEGFRMCYVAPALRTEELARWALQHFCGSIADMRELLESVPCFVRPSVSVAAACIQPELIPELFSGPMDKKTLLLIIETHAPMGSDESVLQFLRHPRDDHLRDDPEVVLADVHCSGAALCFASRRLQGDRGFVLEAVAIDRGAIEHVAANLRFDQGFLRDAAERQPDVLWIAAGQLEAELAAKAVRSFPRGALCRLREELRGRPDIWKAAVAADPMAIEFVPRAQCGREVVAGALAKTPHVLRVVGHWQHDRAFALSALSREGLLLSRESLRLIWGDDTEVVGVAVAQNGLALEYASQRLRGHPQVVERALNQNGLALAFVVRSMRHFDGLVRVAVRQNFYALAFSHCCGAVEIQEKARGARLPPLPSSQTAWW